MNRASNDDLLGYTLGALEPEEYERIDAIVRENGQLRAGIEELRRRLAPLDELAGPCKPRAGLARRTCECIAAIPLHVSHSLAAADLPVSTASPGKPSSGGGTRHFRFASRREPLSGTGRRSVMDFVMIAVVFLLLAAIALPAIQTSRYYSRVAGCQSHLGTVGMSLLAFANAHGGRHLEIPEDPKLGIAGIFAPTLMQAGYISDPSVFYCCGAPQSENSVPLIPTLDQLESTDGSDLLRLQRMAGGDFAFSLGYLENGRYAPAVNRSRSNYALLADNPGPGPAGQVSANHGGYGQNVFFEDGHFEFLKSPVVAGGSIYENDLGEVRPGVNIDDSVLASSGIPVLAPTIMPN